ncbi:MAG TPA: SWIM zinc finger family protein [Clostridia bacterium]|nr:SWIM zinc finger family protein [Clostridia bacterium]
MNPKIITLTVPSTIATAEIESSDGADSYKVDLSASSCTCPDWMDRRSEFPPGDLRRCCKHVIAVLHRNRVKLDDSWLSEIVSYHGRTMLGIRTDIQWLEIDIPKGKALLSVYPGCDWINVFTNTDAGAFQYGWNVDQKRWARGESPAGALAICNAIASLGLHHPNLLAPQVLPQAPKPPTPAVRTYSQPDNPFQLTDKKAIVNKIPLKQTMRTILTSDLRGQRNLIRHKTAYPLARGIMTAMFITQVIAVLGVLAFMFFAPQLLPAQSEEPASVFGVKVIITLGTVGYLTGWFLFWEIGQAFLDIADATVAATCSGQPLPQFATA